MSFMLAFNIATDAAVTSVVVGLLIWGIVADACGAWTLLRPRRSAARSLSARPEAVGAT